MTPCHPATRGDDVPSLRRDPPVSPTASLSSHAAATHSFADSVFCLRSIFYQAQGAKRAQTSMVLTFLCSK